jgi:hypothetical protein
MTTAACTSTIIHPAGGYRRPDSVKVGFAVRRALSMVLIPYSWPLQP